MDSAPVLTFVSTNGPTLDKVGERAMRAHTTRANFARRRRRLVQEHTSQKELVARIEPLGVARDVKTAISDLAVDTRLSFFAYSSLDRLQTKDSFLINNLGQAMERLHLVTDTPESETAFSVIRSDWAGFLDDPTMLDVTLYFARHVYLGRRQHHAGQLIVDTYKGKAIHSVRERLNTGFDSVNDGLVAAILLLTVLDQVLGNIEAWKIHMTGLVQIITIRFGNSPESSPRWITNAIPRTTMQGLLLLARQDSTLLNTIEKTGIFETMFSRPAKKAAYVIVENAQQVAVFQNTYDPNKRVRADEQSRLDSIIKSLDGVIALNFNAYPREAFLTAIALSIKVFLGIVLCSTTKGVEGPGKTAVQLMEAFGRPEQQLPSSLALCSSLESIFWQTMMGAIAAPDDDRIKAFFTSRLDRITVALALTSWHEAVIVLQRFFWIPAIFSSRGYGILSEVLHSQGHTFI